MGDDLKPAKLNPNVWYHVTEGRVDNHEKTKFESMFQIVDVAKNNGDKLAVWGNVKPAQHWQFMPVDPENPARYAVRSSVRGIRKQLGTCFDKDEIDEQHTQPCLLRSDGSDTQKWDITMWPGNNNTYRFQNVHNGTRYNMDVHIGNPPFMSSDIDPRNYQKAQHWLMTSVSDINDGAYSTTFTDVPVSTVTSAGTTQTLHATSPTAAANTASSSGLSSGAAAGIGVAVLLAVIVLLAAGFLLWRHGKRVPSRGKHSPIDELGEHEDSKIGRVPGSQSSYHDVKMDDQAHEMMHTPAPQEVPGSTHYELDAMLAPGQSHR